jgi:hexosaminidase
MVILSMLNPMARGDDKPSIVPKPVEITPGVAKGGFELNGDTRITISGEDLRPIAEYLVAHLKPASGFSPAIVAEKSKVGDISLTTKDVDVSLGEEGYALATADGNLVIAGRTPAGVFHGVQTLRQLLPPKIESRTPVNDLQWAVPPIQIRDWPRFSYRGFMLDSCRHMQSIDFIKRTIDLMALYKLNRFHWHLTEDQGWRIETAGFTRRIRSARS